MTQESSNLNQKIRIAGIVRESIVDGPGIRFVVFSQGCPHSCEGCWNAHTQSFDGGYDVEISKVLQEIDKNPLLAGVTFSGGEPFCQAGPLYELGLEIKKRGLSLMSFSGYTLEELQSLAKTDPDTDGLLQIIDYLVDGPFVLAEKDLTLEFRGSRNQRFIDMSTVRESE